MTRHVAEALDALNSEVGRCYCNQGLYERPLASTMLLLKALAVKHGKIVLSEQDLVRARSSSLRVFSEGNDLSITSEV